MNTRQLLAVLLARQAHTHTFKNENPVKNTPHHPHDILAAMHAASAFTSVDDSQEANRKLHQARHMQELAASVSAFSRGIRGEPAQPSVAAPQALLHRAAELLASRGTERDSNGKGQERSMAATVAAFNAVEGTALTERQGWAFMQTLKLVRAASTARNGRYNEDDYLDGAAYAALAGECAEASNKDGTK